MDATVRALIEQYGMTPLPLEGTYFASTYRSVAETNTAAGTGPVGTAMIGLYAAEPLSRSLFHRLAFDEVWHHYRGDPIRLVLLHPDGTSSDITLGEQCVQYVIPAGTWQAGELAPGGAWALFGCTMAPGFTGSCFEGGTTAALLATHPDRADDIHRLAVPAGHGTAMPDGFAT